MTDRRPWIRIPWPLLATLVLGSIQSTSASAAAVIASPTQDAAVQAVLVSTSGTLETSWGPRTLIGEAGTDASGDGIRLGSIAVGERNDNPWAGILHLQFQFNNGLPSINLDGRVRWLAYNPMESLINPKVATTANEAQLALYPPIFQRMIAHPDWIRTISFGSKSPTMDIALSVQPKSPGDAVVVPEPSTLVAFATALVGMGWRTRRQRTTGVA